MTIPTSLRTLFSVVSMMTAMCVVAQSHWENRTYYETPLVLHDSIVGLECSHECIPKKLSIEARGTMKGIGERRGMAPCYWGMKVCSTNDSILIVMRHGNTDFGDIFDCRFTRIIVNINNEEIESKDFNTGFATSSGDYNTLLLELDFEKSSLSLFGGDHFCYKLVEIPLRNITLADAEAFVWSKGELLLSSLSVETSIAPESQLATAWTQDSLDDYLNRSSDPVEGYWEYLDRKNDPQYARLGGRYRLAVVRSVESPEQYDLLYVYGAETFASQWKPFMLKGKMFPTIFQSHYDLYWYDSTFHPITSDIHASITDNAILTLSFPLLKTIVRLSKATDDKKRKTYQEQSEIH